MADTELRTNDLADLLGLSPKQLADLLGLSPEQLAAARVVIRPEITESVCKAAVNRPESVVQPPGVTRQKMTNVTESTLSESGISASVVASAVEVSNVRQVMASASAMASEVSVKPGRRTNQRGEHRRPPSIRTSSLSRESITRSGKHAA